MAPDNEWDLANRMLIGWSCCHAGHHNPGVRDTRIEFDRIPEAARVFAQRLMGPAPAAIYFARRYRVRKEV
jgi:hypothetical protein